MKKIIYLFFTFLLMLCLTACSIFNNDTKKNTYITIGYVINDKKEYRTYDDYNEIEFIDYQTTTGYEFVGWSLDKETIVTKTDLKDKTEVTLYPIVKLINYKIIYELDGGENNPSNPNYYTIESEIDIYSPTKTGYAFSGWTTDTITTPTSNYKIEKGSYGNITLMANYIHGKVNVIFYGYEELNQVIDYNTTCTKPTDPVKFGDTFKCWCTDPSLDASTEFDFTTPITNTITLYPKWNNTVFYTLTIENSELIESNYSNASKLPKDVVINLKTDYIIEDYEFKGWYVNDELYSKNYKLSITMPSSNLKITPVFNSINTLEYTLNTNTNLYTGIIKQTDGKLYGSNVYNNYGHTTSNELYILPTVLEKLSPGLHSFMYEDRLIINVFIKVKNKDVTNILVDYDINYPKATLLFDYIDGYTYSYSLDNGTYKECVSGEMFTISNKLIAHTIDVKCEDGSPVNYVIEAIPATAQTYLEKQFTYQGNTYDHYVETDSDLKAILEYCIYAKYPSLGGTEYDFTFFYNGSDLDDKCKKIIRRELSIPYGLVYGISSVGKVVTITLSSSGKFNTEKTSQTNNNLEHTQFLPSYRSSTYNDFYIEKCSKTQTIRSIYELEVLNIGIRPIIEDTKAQVLYERAKNILRDYVGDYMTDFEKVNAIYDYLATYVTYDYKLLEMDDEQSFEPGVVASDYQSFTAYAALVEGIAVCDGISSAFKLLCTMEGIESIEVIGAAANGGHAWNKVKLGNVWYGVDTTWSRTTLTDVGEFVSHRYFMINEIGLKTIGNCHYEQGEIDGGYIKYFNIDITSNSSLDYYELKMYGNYDLVCSSKSEFKEMYYALKDNQVDYVELRLSGVTPTEIIQANSTIFGSIYNVYSSSSDLYHVTLLKK